jgi:hypothetical protein
VFEFHFAGAGPTDVSGDSLGYGVAEAEDYNLVAGAEPSKIRTDCACGPAFGKA